MCQVWSTSRPVLSTGDIMYVEIYSDFAIKEQGFMIEFSSETQSEAAAAHQEAPPYYCECKFNMTNNPVQHGILCVLYNMGIGLDNPLYISNVYM